MAYIRNVYKLRRRLTLLSNEKWVAWLQSPALRSIWSLLWRQWLGHHQHSTEMLEPLRLKAFRLCATNFRFYTSRNCVLGPDSEGAEHLARFLTLAVLHTFGPNVLSKLAVITEPLYLMWAVMLVVKLAHAPMYIDMPRRGKGAFGSAV
jgi:hypothetical protein